jgi:chromosome segregation ATPase
VDTGSATADWKSVRTSLDQICQSRDEIEHFFSGVFERLQGFCEELVRRHKAWLRDKQDAQTHLDRRAAELNEARDRLADEWNQRPRPSAADPDQAAQAGGSSGEAFQRILEEAESQHAALRSAQEAARSQADRLTELAEQLVRTGRELSETREQLQQQRQALEAPCGGTSSADGALREKLDRLETERAEWQQERAILETELEAVRNRVAELAEALADEKRAGAEERTRWSDELKRMRRLLERSPGPPPDADAAAAPGAPVPVSPEPSAEPCAAKTAAVGDPVLDSVAAQFEMLQKDAAKRRQSSSKSRPTER